MCLGPVLCPCQWNLWVKLTTADWVYNSYTTVLTDCKGDLVLLPFFQCCLDGMNHTSSRMRKFLGVLGAHLLLFTHIFWMFGQAWGPTARLGIEHSLDGLLHRTRAIGGACCFLHNALSPHPIPSYTALESSYSWGCLLTCPLKKHTLLRFFWTRLEK